MKSIKAGEDFIYLRDTKKKKSDNNNYIPLQAKVGDLAVFLRKGAIEVEFHKEKFLIVPQHSILLLERDGLSED